MSSDELSQKAADYFLSGYSCAQSVLMALIEHIDPKCRSELIPKIASGLGGGIGRCGSVCGALTGAVLAVGIKYGTNEAALEKRLQAYQNAKALYSQFEKQHGSVLCRDLYGYDLWDPEQAAKARQENIREKVCVPLIKSAVAAFLALEHTELH
jgi:C_GCAxxG_C_C family probable redox protein